MQIDFHHTVTYVTARLAGFDHEKADIIAYSAQYVDDATNGGTIKFDNGAMYKRISSAHKMVDYRHFHELDSIRVWTPFHFLPGNGGMKAEDNPEGSFVNKLVCKPNSYVAQDMINMCLADRDKPYGLHRLGISMHVYADTWAHREFAGVSHKINNVELLSHDDEATKSYFSKMKDAVTNFAISNTFPLGHGAALSYPDRPYLEWEYENGFGEVISRDNTNEFTEAANEMFRVMQQFQGKKPTSIPKHDMETIKLIFQAAKTDDGEERHKEWLEQIAKGSFSFGAQELEYIPKGKNSWKHQAIGTIESDDTGEEEFIYNDSFLTSNWKMFHDALQAHRFDVIHDILPKYGISAG